jgi:predicted glycoside hydrolase/deacetylase ChbG (UPF0249 family)
MWFDRKAMKRTLILLVTAIAFAWAIPIANAQGPGKSLAEKLGYARDAKLLIVHADDVGMTHSVNAATIAALENGYVNSASIMAPCPWFPEIANYAKTHPDFDFGLHLTLTSERVYYRWGPVAPKDQVASLVDANGYFHLDWPEGKRIDPKEAELELRAQVDRAQAMGIRLTHLDSHQYRLIRTGPELFKVFVRVAHAYKLPLFVTRDWFAEHPYLESSLSPDDVVIDHTVTIEPSVAAEKWGAFYKAALENLKPGVTEFVIHLAYNNDEMKAATRERDTWGAAWRQRDFDFFSSEEFKRLLREGGIKLVTRRELATAAKR